MGQKLVTTGVSMVIIFFLRAHHDPDIELGFFLAWFILGALIWFSGMVTK